VPLPPLRPSPAPIPVLETADAGHPALVDAAGPVSYAAWAERVEVFAADLPSVDTGRRLVHVPLKAERELIAAYLAVLQAGHVALVTPPEHTSITGAYPPDVWLRDDGTFHVDAGEARYELHPDLALLLSTSGSTGSPKLVRLSHDNLVSNADAIAAALTITPADRAVTSLPLQYCFGLSVLHAQLRAGATAVLWHGSVTEPDFADVLRRNRVTLLPATPHLVDIFDVQGVLDGLPSLRLLAQAGGALPPARVLELAARGRAGGWGLAVMYGQTEATARLSYLPPEELGKRLGSIGKGLPGAELRVLHPDGTPVAPGEVGEIVARGDNVTLGYWDDPVQTAQSFRDGALWTGDLARVDADGYITIVDRAKDFIKASGHRVAAKEVEDHLVALGDVVEAAVIGVPDELLGEAIKAFVVLRQGTHATPEEILRRCRGIMPSHQVPRELVLVPALPRGPSGKVSKAALRDS
jgi:acyl-coenzyme A synthetase/AMP-(fatty) acid ligase